MNEKDAAQYAIDQITRAKSLLPDLRVCQLIVNATGSNNPFYVEDEHLGESIAEFLSIHAPPPVSGNQE